MDITSVMIGKQADVPSVSKGAGAVGNQVPGAPAASFAEALGKAMGPSQPEHTHTRSDRAGRRFHHEEHQPDEAGPSGSSLPHDHHAVAAAVQQNASQAGTTEQPRLEPTNIAGDGTENPAPNSSPSGIPGPQVQQTADAGQPIFFHWADPNKAVNDSNPEFQGSGPSGITDASEVKPSVKTGDQETAPDAALPTGSQQTELEAQPAGVSGSSKGSSSPTQPGLANGGQPQSGTAGAADSSQPDDLTLPGLQPLSAASGGKLKFAHVRKEQAASADEDSSANSQRLKSTAHAGFETMVSTRAKEFAAAPSSQTNTSSSSSQQSIAAAAAPHATTNNNGTKQEGFDANGKGERRSQDSRQDQNAGAGIATSGVAADHRGLQAATAPAQAANHSPVTNAASGESGTNLTNAATATAETRAAGVKDQMFPSHESKPLPPDAAAAAHAAAAAQETGGAQSVNVARLVQRSGEAEMRVDVRSDSLGPMQLRAVVHEGAVGASISVTTPEAHAFLARELPNLHSALHQREVRVDEIRIVQDGSGGASPSGGFDSQNNSEQRQPQRPAARSIVERETAPEAPADPWSAPEDPRRLSVRV